MSKSYLKEYKKWKNKYINLKKIIGGQREKVDYDKIKFEFIKFYDAEYCQVEDQIQKIYSTCNPKCCNKKEKKSFIPLDLPAWVILAYYKNKIQAFMFLIKIEDLLKYYKKKKINNPEKKIEEHTGKIKISNFDLTLCGGKSGIKNGYFIGYICENNYKYEDLIDGLFKFFFTQDFRTNKNNWLMVPIEWSILDELSKANYYYLHAKPEDKLLINIYEKYGFKHNDKKYKDKNILSRGII